MSRYFLSVLLTADMDSSVIFHVSFIFLFFFYFAPLVPLLFPSF